MVMKNRGSYRLCLLSQESKFESSFCVMSIGNEVV